MKKLLLILTFLLTICASYAADMSRGITFTDGQRITAAQLHQLVDQATVVPGFYTGKVLQTNLNATDIVLVYSPASGTFHRVTGDQLLLNNVDWVNTRPEKIGLNTNDYFVFYNKDGGVLSRVAYTNIFFTGNNALINAAQVSSNLWNNYWLLAWDGTPNPTSSNYWRVTVTNIYDNLGTNWQSWFQLGPTNAAHTNITVPLATLNDDYRFWTSYGTTNGATTNFYTTLGAIKRSTTNGSLIGEARDLVMQATNATIQLLNCTDMILKSSNGVPFSTGSVTLTNNLALATPTNGVDTGVAGVSSNWYYIHVMSDGTNVATIASLSSNNPALPAPFIYRALAGPAFYWTNSAYLTNYQVGREVFLYPTNIINTTFTTSFAMQASSSINNAIPPIATQLYGNAGSASASTCTLALAADNNGMGEININIPTTGFTTDNMAASASFRLPLRTNQTFAVKRGGNSVTYRIDVTGYKF